MMVVGGAGCGAGCDVEVAGGRGQRHQRGEWQRKRTDCKKIPYK
jgi:hypothetical protein